MKLWDTWHYRSDNRTGRSLNEVLNIIEQEGNTIFTINSIYHPNVGGEEVIIIYYKEIVDFPGKNGYT